MFGSFCPPSRAQEGAALGAGEMGEWGLRTCPGGAPTLPVPLAALLPVRVQDAGCGAAARQHRGGWWVWLVAQTAVSCFWWQLVPHGHRASARRCRGSLSPGSAQICGWVNGPGPRGRPGGHLARGNDRDTEVPPQCPCGTQAQPPPAGDLLRDRVQGSSGTRCCRVQRSCWWFGSGVMGTAANLGPSAHPVSGDNMCNSAVPKPPPQGQCRPREPDCGTGLPGALPKYFLLPPALPACLSFPIALVVSRCARGRAGRFAGVSRLRSCPAGASAPAPSPPGTRLPHGAGSGSVSQRWARGGLGGSCCHLRNERRSPRGAVRGGVPTPAPPCPPELLLDDIVLTHSLFLPTERFLQQLHQQYPWGALGVQ